MIPLTRDTDSSTDESIAEWRRFWRCPPRERRFLGKPGRGEDVHETGDSLSWSDREVDR